MKNTALQPKHKAPRKTAKHDSIVNALRTDIIRGGLQAGGRLAVHTDLAKRFGVSVVTIQSALNHLGREGFIHARPRKGTFVAERLPHLTNYALVFWNDPLAALGWSKYYVALTNAALTIEREEQRKITQFHGIDQHADNEDRQRLLSLVHAHQLAGMIFANTPMFLVGTPLLEEPGIPRVALMDKQLYPHVPIVTFTGFLERALDYLCERGRKRIAIVGIETYVEYEKKVSGLLQERGLNVPSYWRQYVSQYQPGGATHCVELLMHAPAGERPDGLIITDDNLVEHSLGGLVLAGVRVPQNVEVVTLCNFPWPAASVLPVKRLGFDVRQVLRTCIDLIDRQRQGEAVPGCTAVPAISEEELKGNTNAFPRMERTILAPGRQTGKVETKTEEILQ